MSLSGSVAVPAGCSGVAVIARVAVLASQALIMVFALSQVVNYMDIRFQKAPISDAFMYAEVLVCRSRNS